MSKGNPRLLPNLVNFSNSWVQSPNLWWTSPMEDHQIWLRWSTGCGRESANSSAESSEIFLPRHCTRNQHSCRLNVRCWRPWRFLSMLISLPADNWVQEGGTKNKRKRKGGPTPPPPPFSLSLPFHLCRDRYHDELEWYNPFDFLVYHNLNPFWLVSERRTCLGLLSSASVAESLLFYPEKRRCTSPISCSSHFFRFLRML